MASTLQENKGIQPRFAPDSGRNLPAAPPRPNRGPFEIRPGPSAFLLHCPVPARSVAGMGPDFGPDPTLIPPVLFARPMTLPHSPRKIAPPQDCDDDAPAPAASAHGRPRGGPFGWLVAPDRSPRADLTLALILTAMAGASNAGGFFAVGQYTSHMSGYLSQLADSIAIADMGPALVYVLAITAFACGAVAAAMLIAWAGVHARANLYALPVAVQGGFLIGFAGGEVFTTEAGRLFAIWCLCFIMGFQNGAWSIFSNGSYRTTHVTGTVTDLATEIGRGAYGLIDRRSGAGVDGARLGRLARLLGAFFGGGVIGAFGYGHFGFYFSLPLAAILLAISLPWLIETARSEKASPTRPDS